MKKLNRDRFSTDLIGNWKSKIFIALRKSSKEQYYDIHSSIDSYIWDYMVIVHDAVMNDSSYQEVSAKALLKQTLEQTQPRCDICFGLATQRHSIICGGYNEPPKTYHYCDEHAPEEAHDLDNAQLIRLAKPFLK